MCGICGEFAFGGAPADPAGLAAMRAALSHRGPDDAGSLVAGSLGLGHTRLAIIDLSPRGRQPMTDGDGRVAIVFNGEIYNYAALREELAASGAHFASDTDTEVAASALAQWDVDALPRFIGMFALAVYDTRRRSLLLARDRLGVKPLYYAAMPERFLFASEPRAILAHPTYTPRVERKALASFLQCGYFPGEDTIFTGIRKLPPGSWMRLGAQGIEATGRYWSLGDIRRGSFTGSFDDAADALRPLLAEAFAHRLVADVPVGLFLSGGVDSALVASILRHDRQTALHSFTIGFASPEFDEANSAQVLSERLGLPHNMRRIDATTAQGAVHDLYAVYDEPFGDPSAIPTCLLSRLAREHVKVALSADGGDELFCGYTGHVRYPGLYGRLRVLPPGLRRSLAGLIRSLPWHLLLPGSKSRVGQVRTDRLSRLARLLGARNPRELLIAYAARGFFNKEATALAGLAKATLPPGFCEAARTLDHAANPDELTDMLMRHDVRFWLPDDILVKVDRASMHLGLECRDPLLDHRVAAFAASLPMDYLCGDGVQKRILRRLLADLGSPDLAGAPKRGFDIPLREWLLGPWRPLVEDHLSPARLQATDLLDPATAHNMARRFLSGRGGSAHRIWLLVSLQLWAGRWLNGSEV